MKYLKNRGLRALAIGAIAGLAAPASAQTVVGTIAVCYYAPACTYTQPIGLNPPVDAPAFQITNTSTTPITHAVFTLLKAHKDERTRDRFVIGRISPGKSVVIVPGFSNDGSMKHAPGSLFAHTGSPKDTSESGPDGDLTGFDFEGKSDGSIVASGAIRAWATVGRSNDGTVAHINFLGGPNDADGPCNDCFGPKQIGVIFIVQ